MINSMFVNEYTPPTLTVDSVVFQITNNELVVLLIKRTQEPFLGERALPGGYNPAGETTQQAQQRILLTKTGVQSNQLKLVEQLYTFDTVARDPRGHAVSITYMGLGKDIVPTASKTTQAPHFFAVSTLPALPFGHNEIIQYAHERLQSKISYTNAIYALLDPLFTLSQLQAAYEAVLCRPVDKRNFRKKFLSLNLIHETNEKSRDGAHRPARLFAFNNKTLETLARSFD